MFCENCGKQIDDDSLFCVHCGSKTEPIVKPVMQSAQANTVKPEIMLPYAIVQMVLNLALAISPFLSLFSIKKLLNYSFSVMDMGDAIAMVGNIMTDLEKYNTAMKVFLVIGWLFLAISLIKLIFGKSAKSYWSSAAMSCFAFCVMYGILYYVFERIKSATIFELVGVDALFYVFSAISVMGVVLALAMKVRSKK